LTIPEIGSPGRWHDRWPPETMLVLALAIMILLFAPLNADSGWYLLGARRVLGGERLYVDLIEVNPPLIFWMFVPPAIISDYLPISDDVAVSLFVAALLLSSFFLALRVLALPRGPGRIVKSCLVCAFLLSVVLLFLFGVGQREQICAILFFPYTVLAGRAASRLETPRWLAIVVGIFAGAGVALKPFFLAPWLAVEFVVVAAQRQRFPFLRTASSVVLLIQCLYAAIVIVVTPAYLSRAIPLARATYWAYGIGGRALLSSRLVVVLLLWSLTALAIPLLLRVRRVQPLGQVYAAASLGFLISYVAQLKGFWYHPIPAQIFAVLAVVATGETVWEALVSIKFGWRRVAATMSALAVLFAVIACLAPAIQQFRSIRAVVTSRYPPLIARMADTIREGAVGEPVYVFSTSVWPAFPIVNLAGATWPYHYNCLWPLPALYRGIPGTEPHYRLPDEQGRLEKAFFDTIVSDLTTTPPRLLIVEHGTRMQAMRGQDFNFIRYFSGSAKFATLFGRYHRLGTIADWEFFERW